MLDYSATLRTNGFICLNKVLLRTMGLDKTVFLCHLFDLYEYYKDRDMLIDGDEFFIKHEDWEIDTGQKRHTFNQCVAWAEELELISTKRQGLPAFKFYKINHAEVNCFLRDVFDEKKNPKPVREKRTYIPIPSKAKDVPEDIEKGEESAVLNDDMPPEDISEEGFEEAVENLIDRDANQDSRKRESIYKEDLKLTKNPPKSPLAGGSVSVNRVEPQCNDGLIPVEAVKTKKSDKKITQQTMQDPVKALSSMTRTKKWDQLTPSEQEKLNQEVTKIVNWSREQGKTDDPTRSRAKLRIRERLLDGWKPEVLLLALKRYVFSKDQEHRDKMGQHNDGTLYADSTYFYGLGNFFGKEAYFLEYLDDEIDWNWRTNTPNAAQQNEKRLWYNAVKEQYIEKYGDNWELELHKSEPWEKMWEEEIELFQWHEEQGKLGGKTWKEELYGAYGEPEDISLCPGRKQFARDYDPSCEKCQGCPVGEDCGLDQKQKRWDMSIIVDQITHKWLWEPDREKIRNTQLG